MPGYYNVQVRATDEQKQLMEIAFPLQQYRRLMDENDYYLNTASYLLVARCVASWIMSQVMNILNLKNPEDYLRPMNYYSSPLIAVSLLYIAFCLISLQYLVFTMKHNSEHIKVRIPEGHEYNEAIQTQAFRNLIAEDQAKIMIAEEHNQIERPFVFATHTSLVTHLYGIPSGLAVVAISALVEGSEIMYRKKIEAERERLTN